MITKNFNKFDDSKREFEELMCFADTPNLENFHNWLEKYPKAKVIQLEVNPEIYRDQINGKKIESIRALVSAEVMMPDEYGEKGYSSVDDFIPTYDSVLRNEDFPF